MQSAGDVSSACPLSSAANSSTIAEVIAFVKRAIPSSPSEQTRDGRVPVPHLRPPNLMKIKTAASTGRKVGVCTVAHSAHTLRHMVGI